MPAIDRVGWPKPRFTKSCHVRYDEKQGLLLQLPNRHSSVIVPYCPGYYAQAKVLKVALSMHVKPASRTNPHKGKRKSHGTKRRPPPKAYNPASERPKPATASAGRTKMPKKFHKVDKAPTGRVPCIHCGALCKTRLHARRHARKHEGAVVQEFPCSKVVSNALAPCTHATAAVLQVKEALHCIGNHTSCTQQICLSGKDVDTSSLCQVPMPGPGTAPLLPAEAGPIVSSSLEKTQRARKVNSTTRMPCCLHARLANPSNLCWLISAARILALHPYLFPDDTKYPQEGNIVNLIDAASAVLHKPNRRNVARWCYLVNDVASKNIPQSDVTKFLGIYATPEAL